MGIQVNIDVLLAQRQLSVGEFAEAVGISAANVAVLKNGRAKAIRFSTLAAICRVLECQPGDIMTWDGQGESMPQSDGAANRSGG